MLPDYQTLIDLLCHRCSSSSELANKTAFSFLQDGETVSHQLSFVDLGHAARRLAARLQRQSEPGERVVLMYPPSLDFVVAFCACIFAGRTAVPAMAPTRSRHAARLHRIVRDSGATVALSTPSIQARLQAQPDPELQHLRWLAPDVGAGVEADWQRPAIAADDIAFVQYTSGTTGPARGVGVSHRMLLANVVIAQGMMGAGSTDVGVSWLPPYHDFGLIAGIAGSLYAGSHCIQMPPVVFAMQPYLWLKALSTWHARVGGAPNFAYELCLRRVTPEQKKTLDLSALELMLNGGELIRPATMRRFAAAFSECGFRAESFCPAYGLAESTLMFAVNLRQRGSDQLPATYWVEKKAVADQRVEAAPVGASAMEYVCLGPPMPQHEAAILTEDGRQWRSASPVGEICIRGPSVCMTYWNTVDSEPHDENAWLPTGDLGFMDDAGCLFVTGRVDELMVFGPISLYAQDVEAGVEVLDSALLPSSAAAFSIETAHGPGLMLLQEITPTATTDTAKIVHAIRQTLHEQFTVPLVGVLLLSNGALPRTTSGKIQRHQARELFMQPHRLAHPAWTVLDFWLAASETLPVKDFPEVSGRSETNAFLSLSAS